VEEQAETQKVATSSYKRLLNRIQNWASKDNYQPTLVGANCCGLHLHQLCSSVIEESTLLSSHMDYPIGQSDLLIINGHINHRMLPKLLQAYEELAGNKYVMAVGSCTMGKKSEDDYNLIDNITNHIPVDVYVPGCPPTMEDFLKGLMELKNKR
jgi:NADH:ubiquinone oxidoreductase subunit B-like Fe-S oxidoreductase